MYFDAFWSRDKKRKLQTDKQNSVLVKLLITLRRWILVLAKT